MLTKFACLLQAQDAAGDAAGSAKSAAGDASGSAKSAGGDITSGAKSAVGDAKGAAQGAGRQIDQATPDLSGVFDGLLDKVAELLKAHAVGDEYSTILPHQPNWPSHCMMHRWKISLQQRLPRSRPSV